MKIRNLGLMVGALSAIGLSVLGLSGVSCTQPAIPCTVGHGPFAVQYFPKDAASDCLQLPGELVGMATYHPATPDGKNTDVSKTTVAIQASMVGSMVYNEAGAVDEDPTHTLFSLGAYTTDPDANDICTASGLTPAEQHLPQTDYEVDDGMGGTMTVTQPEMRWRYEWTNTQVYVTFAAPGTAATSDVTITYEETDPTTGMTNSCTTTYTANMLWPAVYCEGTDAEGNATGMPDDSLCCPKPDESKGRVFGSGINPDFKTKCDPATLFCVLDWTPAQGMEAFPPTGVNPICGSSE